MGNRKDFNSQFATLKLREEIEETEEKISEAKTIFSIDNQKIDDLFLNNFTGNVDYLHDGSDVYYATDQNDLQKFVDYIESLGLDSDSIRLRTNFQEDDGAAPAAPTGNTTSDAGAYNASLNATSKKQNPFKEGLQEYFIQVDIRDAKTALAIIDDSYTLSNTIKKRSSDVYTTFDAMAAEELVDSLKQNGINNKNNVVGYVDEDVLSGYQKLTGFRPGHTPDKGGFQYKDLWDLNENYNKFRNETKTRTKPEQFHQAVKSVKKKIEEINKLYEYMERLKTELSEGKDGLKYRKYTENAIFKIKEAVKALHLKIKKLK